MRLEHVSKPLLSRKEFSRRQARYAGFALVILVTSLGLGTAGYHVFGRLSWPDAFLNASMILTGMGPVDKLDTTSAKLFAAFYALYSGIAFLTFAGILFAPAYHRFLHKLHIDMAKD